jgi:hypothetical protein
MDYVKLKVRAKDYEGGFDRGNLNTKWIIQDTSMYDWWLKNFGVVGDDPFSPESKMNTNKRYSMHGKNIEQLTAIFGEQSFCWQGEFHTMCWVLDFGQDTKILIKAANDEGGTGYDVVTSFNGENYEPNESVLQEAFLFICDKLYELNGDALAT